ncbi:hypothetical protein ElyMa_003316700 [Elysia marginata]|uniref:Uncharacterized protein n=1 Tax=Elysia marginata TaxID=1093978 RepID=A0AAV4JFD3_9GAST|nr:hypothetical protein ElyMa_003316700 [Elysia marginata]
MNSATPYGSFPEYAQKLDQTLLFFSTNPISADDELKPVFEDFPLDDKKDILAEAFKQISSKSTCVVKPQLSDFLEGGIFFEIADETKAILDKCPLTNLVGERIFGDLDFDMLRKRYASTHHRSSTIRWKHNKTAVWLEKQGEEEKNRVMEAAVENRSLLREKHKGDVRRVREQIKERLELEENDDGYALGVTYWALVLGKDPKEDLDYLEELRAASHLELSPSQR